MPRMYHDDPVMTGGPTTADVPEEAIGWMQRAGWYLKDGDDLEQAKTKNPASAKGEAAATSAKK